MMFCFQVDHSEQRVLRVWHQLRLHEKVNLEHVYCSCLFVSLDLFYVSEEIDKRWQRAAI